MKDNIEAKNIIFLLVKKYLNENIEKRHQEQIELAKYKAAAIESKRLYEQEDNICGFGYNTYEREISSTEIRIKNYQKQEFIAELALKIVVEKFIEESEKK
jgi:hypothetical protein